MYINYKGEEHKVVFHHVPNPEAEGVRPHTVCVITKGESEELVVAAFAKVHPNDVFDKAKGRQISLGRALQEVIPKEDRLQFWAAYATWKSETPRLPISPRKEKKLKVI